jgi:hypothetical protein
MPSRLDELEAVKRAHEHELALRQFAMNDAITMQWFQNVPRFAQGGYVTPSVNGLPNAPWQQIPNPQGPSANPSPGMAVPPPVRGLMNVQAAAGQYILSVLGQFPNLIERELTVFEKPQYRRIIILLGADKLVLEERAGSAAYAQEVARTIDKWLEALNDMAPLADLMREAGIDT